MGASSDKRIEVIYSFFFAFTERKIWKQGVDFINVKGANFLYERRFGSFF